MFDLNAQKKYNNNDDDQHVKATYITEGSETVLYLVVDLCANMTCVLLRTTKNTLRFMHTNLV